MKANKVFISAPISMDWSTVLKYETVLKKKGFEVKYWDRYTKYDERPLDESDAVVFLLPNNSFKCSEYELPIGLRAELSRAYALDKPLFIGYIRSGDGQVSFYEADSNGKFIAGQAGTCNSLFDFGVVKGNSKLIEVKPLSPPSGILHYVDFVYESYSDSRLLLLL